MPGVKNKTLVYILILMTVALVLYETAALLLVGEPEEYPSDSLFRLILDTSSTGDVAWAGEKTYLNDSDLIRKDITFILQFGMPGVLFPFARITVNDNSVVGRYGGPRRIYEGFLFGGKTIRLPDLSIDKSNQMLDISFYIQIPGMEWVWGADSIDVSKHSIFKIKLLSTEYSGNQTQIEIIR